MFHVPEFDQVNLSDSTLSHLGISSLLGLDDLQYESVLRQDAKDVDDAGDHPGLHRRQTLGLRGVGRHRVEDVDQDEEQGDEERHPA